MQVSGHFDSIEFEHGTTIPQDCLPLLRQFCTEVLEPIRAFIHRPMTITSGDRSIEINAAMHGVKNSEHIWTPRKIAADFTFDTNFGTVLSVRAAFDWIRTSPTLPFHQVILEHQADGTSIIHVSMDLDLPGVRQALEGATHNASPYTKWETVEYTPSSDTASKENG
jgi:Peptidase M15